MTAYVTLKEVVINEAHEDGLLAGDGEWRLKVAVNGQEKTFEDNSVRDGEYLSLGDNVTWTVQDVEPGDKLEFRIRAWETDGPQWLNPDDFLGREDRTLSTPDTSPAPYINPDYEIDGGDYVASFEVALLA